MANLTDQKYDSYQIPWLGTIIKRFPTSNNFDSLGTIDYWEQFFRNLYGQLQWKDVFSRLTAEIWDFDSPDLPKEVRDFDPNTPGNQEAAGLFYAPNRIVIPVKKDLKGKLQFEKAGLILSHEFGHFYELQARGENTISTQIWNTFLSLRPHQAANDDPWEDFAECFRALLGVDEVRGTFSDGKPYTNDRLRSFMKMYLPLAEYLKNDVIRNLEMHDTWCSWKQEYLYPVTHTFLFWTWVSYETRYKNMALTDNYDLFELINGTWKIKGRIVI